MKRFLIIASTIVLVVLVSYLTIRFTREDPTDGTTFYYYPRANIYFDVERSRYIYPDSIKGGWQKSKKMPGSGNEKLGQYVILNHPPQPVWTQNSQHRLVYGTTLYARKDEVRRKFVEDSLRSIVVPKPVTPRKQQPGKEEAEDKRSGIERFFDRLFGKEEDN